MAEAIRERGVEPGLDAVTTLDGQRLLIPAGSGGEIGAIAPGSPVVKFPELKFGEVVDTRDLVVTGAALSFAIASVAARGAVVYSVVKEMQPIYWSGPDISGLPSLPDVFSSGGSADMYNWIHSSVAELARWINTVVTYTSELLNSGFVKVTYDPVASQQTGKVAVDMFGILHKGQSALVEVNGLADGQAVCEPVKRALTPPLRYEEVVLECWRRVDQVLTQVQQPGYEATELRTPIR